MGTYLSRLAGMLPPHNHFELAFLRDQTLLEQGIAEQDRPATLRVFAIERLRLALAGEMNLIAALKVVSDLYTAEEGMRDLLDFFLLYWAYSDLCVSDVQWYWDGATRENIHAIILTRAKEFLREHPEI